MVRLTVLARLEDGLPLAEGVESDKELGNEIETLKPQAKVLPAATPLQLPAESGLVVSRG